MYSIYNYGQMIADRVRMAAYLQAIRQTVRPNSVVVDIGTGTGIFALLACKFGARRVYAIEPEDAIQVAREIAIANGYANRIEFIQELSTRVTPVEQADVVVSDLRGGLPWFQYHIPAIIDARKRFLAPGGILIPERDTLWATVVEARHEYDRYVDPWDRNADGFDMSAARRIVTNTWRKAKVAPEQFLTKPQCWATLDYETLDDPDISSDINWTIVRNGRGHGLSVWFDAILVDGVGFSNAPGSTALYGTAFFPWLAAVSLCVGDTVSVKLSAKLVGQDYIWGWNTIVLEQGDPGRTKANFKQSTFYGVPLSAATLRTAAANHVPTLNENGRIDHFVLGLMEGGASVGDIAQLLVNKFPTRFATFKEALTRAGELSRRYSQ